jgi:hypothetical protein
MILEETRAPEKTNIRENPPPNHRRNKRLAVLKLYSLIYSKLLQMYY